jgi:hypothetical protein
LYGRTSFGADVARKPMLELNLVVSRWAFFAIPIFFVSRGVAVLIFDT